MKTGWLGLIQRITGKRRRIEAENRDAAEKAMHRHLTERKALIEQQRSVRQGVLVALPLKRIHL